MAGLGLRYLFSRFIEVQTFATHVHAEEMASSVRLSIVPAHHCVVPSAGYHLVVGFGIESTCKYSRCVAIEDALSCAK